MRSEEADICECSFCNPHCPVFLAYTFAVQACHLRDRLKQIEDILGGDYDLEEVEAALVERERGEKKAPD